MAWLTLLFAVMSMLWTSVRGESALSTAAPEAGNRTLIILDRLGDRSVYSQFLLHLERNGHEVTIAASSTKSVALGKQGKRDIDTLVVLAPRILGAGLTAKRLVAFIERGGNVILAAGPTSDDKVRDALAEFGVALTPRGAEVVDYHSLAVTSRWDVNRSDAGITGSGGEQETLPSAGTDTGAGSIITTSAIINAPSMVGAETGVLPYKGGAFVLVDGYRATVTAVVRGEAGAFVTATQGGGDSSSQSSQNCAGWDCVLVAAVQGENNARAILLADGGWLLSDDAWAMTALASSHDSVTMAEIVCTSLMSWVSQRSGVLRAIDLTETRPDGTNADLLHPARPTPDLPRSQFPRPETFENERAFRVGEEVIVQVKLQQRVQLKGNHSAEDDQSFEWGWGAFEANDAQIEVVMLDPYVRASLLHQGDGLHTARLRLPDQWGVFKFRLQYRRAGWSTLTLADTVTLRPLEHTEFERYIVAAAPHYVAACACTLLMVVLAGVVLTTSSGKSKSA